jgi:hypothetical protein
VDGQKDKAGKTLRERGLAAGREGWAKPGNLEFAGAWDLWMKLPSPSVCALIEKWGFRPRLCCPYSMCSPGWEKAGSSTGAHGVQVCAGLIKSPLG